MEATKSRCSSVSLKSTAAGSLEETGCPARRTAQSADPLQDPGTQRRAELGDRRRRRGSLMKDVDRLQLAGRLSRADLDHAVAALCEIAELDVRIARLDDGLEGRRREAGRLREAMRGRRA